MSVPSRSDSTNLLLRKLLLSRPLFISTPSRPPAERQHSFPSSRTRRCARVRARAHSPSSYSNFSVGSENSFLSYLARIHCSLSTLSTEVRRSEVRRRKPRPRQDASLSRSLMLTYCPSFNEMFEIRNVLLRSYLLTVFVTWLVVVDWNGGLILSLHQLVPVVSHELETGSRKKKEQRS